MDEVESDPKYTKFGTSPVSNAYFKTMTLEEEDAYIRDMLLSTATQFTDEQMDEIKSEAIWFEFTDDGLKVSKGMVEFFKKCFDV